MVSTEMTVFSVTAGVGKFALSSDNVWYGLQKLLFSLSVKVDGKQEPDQLGCAYVSSFYDIKLDPSGMF